MEITKEQLYFNSIKVRLRLAQQQEEDPGKKFQFHKGSIKTHIDI